MSLLAKYKCDGIVTVLKVRGIAKSWQKEVDLFSLKWVWLTYAHINSCTLNSQKTLEPPPPPDCHEGQYPNLASLQIWAHYISNMPVVVDQ